MDKQNQTENKVKKTINNGKRGELPPKRLLSEEELKAAVNADFFKSNLIYKVVREAVDKMTAVYKKELMDLIDFIDTSLEFKITKDQITGKKSYSMKFNLSEDELSFLAVKIPNVCIHIQECINDEALDSSIADYLFEDAITENLKGISGGDAKERLRFAAQQADIEHIVSMVKKQVYNNLKTYVERADKIYEGVKKVLDGKNNDKKLFGKANQFSA